MQIHQNTVETVGLTLADTSQFINSATFDQLVLAAVFRFRGSGDDITILKKVTELSGEDVFISESLNRLERKGLIESRPANPETESEKKDRRYFMATMAGERALAYAKATSQTIAGLLEDMT